MSGLVAAIIVSCNGINSIGTCLESLVKSTYPNYKIVVVDNGSTDGLNGFVKTYFPDVILISFQKNMGAAGGRNRALKVCEQFDPSYIYCIDDDAKIEADAVTCLINFIENNPKCGFAGSRIMNLDNPKEPHALGAVFDGEKLSVRHLSQAAMDSAYEVDLVSTCSVAFRYNVIKEIGQLDEGFWVYHEDVDWALLAIEKGYKNYIVPSSIAYHKLSSSKYNPRAIYFLTRNIFLLGIKHGYLKSKWDKKVFNHLFITMKNIILKADFVKYTTLLAALLGWCDFARNKFYESPKLFQKKKEDFLEWKFKNYIYNSKLWGFTRNIKHRVLRNHR